MHEQAAFITLSYNDKHLPQYGSLQYADIHKFWKRERQRLWREKGIKLRHYTVGEYGDQSQRPHYHSCVFGYGYLENRLVIREAPLLWTTPELEKAWGLGYVSVGALDYTTASYTASYITKKLRSKQQYVRVDKESGELIPLEQPRAFMSDNLGKTWWEKFGKSLEENDWVIINGKQQKPPKAYDKWLTAKDENKARKIKEKRKEKALENKLTPDQRHARAENARARVKGRKKTI